jgi:CRISPR/Cas system-associated exonuclease Cas4 (RecB family)
MFDIEDKAVIFLIIPGHVSYEQFPEYQEVWIDLLPIKTIDTYIKGKIKEATSSTPPECDCNKSWMCKYCPYSEVCDESTEKKDPQEVCHKGFENESN